MKSTQHVWVIFRSAKYQDSFLLLVGYINLPATNAQLILYTIAAWAWWGQTNRTFSANPICVEHEQAIGRIRKNKNPKTWPLDMLVLPMWYLLARHAGTSYVPWMPWNQPAWSRELLDAPRMAITSVCEKSCQYERTSVSVALASESVLQNKTMSLWQVPCILSAAYS